MKVISSSFLRFFILTLSVFLLTIIIGRNILYSGECGSLTELLYNEDLARLIRIKGIDDFYLDNTMTFTANSNSINRACEAVLTIIK